MNRRAFLTAISCLPFLGFLKPAPVAVFSNAHTTTAPLDDGYLKTVRIDDQYYLANSEKMRESLKWFDEPIRDWKVVTGGAAGSGGGGE